MTLFGKKKPIEAVTFIDASKYFTPQVPIKMTRDVSGWADRRKLQKFAMGAGKTYYVDVETATEFISKGYAEGQVPRAVSEDEQAEWMAQMTTIGVTNNG
jgi:hypothetical protein